MVYEKSIEKLCQKTEDPWGQPSRTLALLVYACVEPACGRSLTGKTAYQYQWMSVYVFCWSTWKEGEKQERLPNSCLCLLEPCLFVPIPPFVPWGLDILEPFHMSPLLFFVLLVRFVECFHVLRGHFRNAGKKVKLLAMQHVRRSISVSWTIVVQCRLKPRLVR